MGHPKDIRNIAQLLDVVRAGPPVRYLHFWGHQPARDGSVTKACFSQWYEAAFEVHGVRFPTAEHFMMAEKARVFADGDTRKRVLAARTPGEAKALGRQVARFSDAVWDPVRFDIVVAANEAKFSQNAALREYLLGTGDQVLVEASPVDRVWGIGLAADHADAAAPERWQGLNLLGFALMAVRSRLAGEA